MPTSYVMHANSITAQQIRKKMFPIN